MSAVYPHEMAVVSTRAREHELLDAARAGDERAFRHIVESHQPELHAHSYRMLGSVHDADDAVQDTLLRAWRGLPTFDARSSLRTWLYTIATNVCRDAITRRSRRVLPIGYGPVTQAGDTPGEPLVESVWIEPYPDEHLGIPDGYAAPEARYEQREALELAFVAALQHLPGTQRAVLILREVLGFSAQEVAASLETTVPSVNSALQRARKSIAERVPSRSQQATLRSLGDRRVRELVAAYVEAWSKADVDALRALLAEDAVFSMPPWASWWRGRHRASGSRLRERPGGRRLLRSGRRHGQVPGGRGGRPHLRRRDDHRDHRLHHARRVRRFRLARRAGLRRAAASLGGPIREGDLGCWTAVVG